jgi:hypothetical protein
MYTPTKNFQLDATSIHEYGANSININEENSVNSITEY